MTQLKLDELTLEQKLGQLIIFCSYSNKNYQKYRENIHRMLKEKKLGGVQVPHTVDGGCQHEIELLNQSAGYPVLICNDMESGCPGGIYKIPSMLSLGTIGSEELAYKAGCAIAIDAKRLGYNTVWGPVVDLLEGDTMLMVPRSLGEDAHLAGKLASAMMKGFADNGMLATAKHWPNPSDIRDDAHIFKTFSSFTEKELIEKTFAPYRYAIKEGTLHGIMSTHVNCPTVDPTYPGTLSEALINIPRTEGFDGVIMTDDLGMTGLTQAFGTENVPGLAVKAGHDMLLIPALYSPKEALEYLMKAYQNGVFSEQRLNEAVARVLAAQEKTLPQASALYAPQETEQALAELPRKSICAYADKNLSINLDPTKKKLFVALVENPCYNQDGEIYDPYPGWGIGLEEFKDMKEKILAKYPDSQVLLMNRLPSTRDINKTCYQATQSDEVIFITNAFVRAYGGGSLLSDHVANTIRSMQDKLAAVIHIGNPYATSKLPHVPRLIFDVNREYMKESFEAALEVLTGEYTPEGKLPIKLDLKE